MNCETYGYDAQRSHWFRTTSQDSGRGKYLEVTSLNSAVRAAPLFLEQWRIARGQHQGQTFNLLFIATSDNTVRAYAEEWLLANNQVPIWTRFLGQPADCCSNIPAPVGICGTPVIDVATRQLFVLALLDDGSGGKHCTDDHGVHTFGRLTYFIFALDVDTGDIKVRVPLRDSGGVGRPTFDANVQDQRGGLNLVNGRIYATFADLLAFDKGTYFGWVASFNASNPGDQWFFPICSRVTGGGAWGPGGAAAAPDGTLYVATGNSPEVSDNYWSDLPPGDHPGDLSDFFEGVVRVDPSFSRKNLVASGEGAGSGDQRTSGVGGLRREVVHGVEGD